MTFEPPRRDEAIEVRGDVWGVSFRVRAAEVDWHIPAGFHVAAATSAAVTYVKQIAGELSRLPHRYGFDPGSTYTVLMQTWDRALMSERSLAFGRTVLGHQEVGLIPDAYYIDSHGYASLHIFALRLPKWSRRSPRVAWRGSVTGRGHFVTPSDIPRVKLALACRYMAGTDVRLIGVHETMDFPSEPLKDFIRNEGLLSQSWPVTAFAQHKFTIDIDGHANAWGLLEKLTLGCCVLKVESPYEQWFYPRLHPWEHYVPVSADLADLPEALQWCRDNDAYCQWIAANGSRLASTLRLQAELPRSCMMFMRTAWSAQS